MQVAVTCFVCLKAIFLTDQHIEIWSVCWNRHLAHVAYGAQEITCFRPQQLLFSYIVSAEQLFTVIELCLVQPKNFVRLKLCHPHRIGLSASAGRDNVWGIYQLWVRLPPSLILVSVEKNFHSLLCSRNTPAPVIAEVWGYCGCTTTWCTGLPEASPARGLGFEACWRWGQAANNYRTIQVKFTRMVYDKENDLVLVNLLEYCRRGPMTRGAERW